jgi:hypothetical protein
MEGAERALDFKNKNVISKLFRLLQKTNEE